MKIISDNAVYVQKSDIMQVMQFERTIPAEIVESMFTSGPIIINSSNCFDFVKFTSPASMEFFAGLDWIVDYGEVKDMPEEDILALCNSLADDYNAIAETYNNLTPHQRKINHTLSTECDKKGYKIDGLREFVWFRRGDLPVTIPDEFDLPESYGIKPKERKNVVKRIRTLFNKNKKNQ